MRTKDSDSLDLLNRFGPPPQVRWITCGNTSNARLRGVLKNALLTALTLLEQGESLVAILKQAGIDSKDVDNMRFGVDVSFVNYKELTPETKSV